MDIDFTPLDMALEMALSRGATAADAYFEQGKGLSVHVFGGNVERFSHSQARGIGVRVFAQGRPGRSYTSDLSEAAVREMVDQAMDAAAVTPPDEHRGLPAPELFPPGHDSGGYLGEELGIYDGRLADVPPGEKIEFTLDLERLAKRYDERVTGVETAAYSESSGQELLANTAGFRAAYRASICYGYLMAMAEAEGETQTGFGFTAGRGFDELDVGAAAEEAAAMAVDLLGARQVETAKVPVLFDNLSTAELLAVLGAALSAESVVKGKSVFAGRVGRQVASPAVQLVDDGLMPGGYGTSPFDGEGVACAHTPLIEAGTLAGFMHNCYTASRMDAVSTGNAGRSSYRATVGVSPTNLVLTRGERSPDELLSAMGTGFEVLELQGVHVGLNPVTGEVSVGAKGRWIEGGKRSYPVREVTLAGTLEGMLQGITGIGSDMRFTPLLGGIGAPSVLVEGLVVSGK